MKIYEGYGGQFHTFLTSLVVTLILQPFHSRKRISRQEAVFASLDGLAKRKIPFLTGKQTIIICWVTLAIEQQLIFASCFLSCKVFVPNCANEMEVLILEIWILSLKCLYEISSSSRIRIGRQCWLTSPALFSILKNCDEIQSHVLYDERHLFQILQVFETSL